MSVGLVFGIVVAAGLALWAIMLFRSRIVERGSEASSFHDSGLGAQDVGHGSSHDSGGGHGGGD